MAVLSSDNIILLVSITVFFVMFFIPEHEQDFQFLWDKVLVLCALVFVALFLILRSVHLKEISKLGLKWSVHSLRLHVPFCPINT